MKRYLFLALLPLAGCTTLTPWGTATMPARTPTEHPIELPTQAVVPVPTYPQVGEFVTIERKPLCVEHVVEESEDGCRNAVSVP